MSLSRGLWLFFQVRWEPQRVLSRGGTAPANLVFTGSPADTAGSRFQGQGGQDGSQEAREEAVALVELSSDRPALGSGVGEAI